MTDKIEKKEATFAMPYNGEDNNDYVDGKGFCCNDGSLEAAQTRALARAAKNNFQEGDAYEKMQFYYHPDHLGSSSYITNCNSSSSTLLYKAGGPLSRIKDLRKQISGLVWGFGDIKPWTVEEQSKAVQRQRELDQLRNEMMNTIILNKY